MKISALPDDSSLHLQLINSFCVNCKWRFNDFDFKKCKECNISPSNFKKYKWD